MRQVEAMRQLWHLRSAGQEIHVPRSAGDGFAVPESSMAVCRTWEYALGSLAIGRSGDTPLGLRLESDPGVKLLRQLVSDARAGFIAEGLRHTMSLLLGTCGAGRVQELLAEFMKSRPPELFVSAEADAFAQFLRKSMPAVPYLDEVLAFEHALIRATLYRESSTIRFHHEPTALLECLDQGRLPDNPPRQEFPVVIQAG
jgi:uncharacterized protein